MNHDVDVFLKKRYVFYVQYVATLLQFQFLINSVVLL